MPGSIYQAMEPVSNHDIHELLTLFSRAVFDVKSVSDVGDIQNKCQELFEKDYKCSKIENIAGELSKNYPPYIIIPTAEKDDAEIKSSNRSTDQFNPIKFKSLATKANNARCWSRCPVPVILCDGKFVCRSSTLACLGESKYREYSNFFASSLKTDVDKNGAEDDVDPDLMEGSQDAGLRILDIKLLKELSVSYICDLMVEMKKIKFRLPISSSEKIDKEKRYSDFKIVQLPYPGCEFFKNFKDNNYAAEGLFFDWEQDYVNSELSIPSDSIVSHLSIHWSRYKTWDLVKLTQRYLKLLQTYILEGTSSILIHCISGWDRTPLFISLLRMSLWADGKVHCSLSPLEMTYLTLAYDWYLFGHDLPSRLKSGEEILLFCFKFLEYISSDTFSFLKSRDRKISGSIIDCQLGVLTEDSPVKGSSSSLSSSGSSSSFKSQDNCPPTIFHTHPDPFRDHCSRSIFYANIDSGDESDIKNGSCSPSPEGLASALTLTSSSDHWPSGRSTPPTMTNSLEAANATNNNGVEHLFQVKQIISSSPVPVPNVRQRLDSSSSVGSWQFVSAAGSVQGSATDKSSLSSNASEANLNTSRSKHILCHETSEAPPSSSTSFHKSTRKEKLKCIQNLFQEVYKEVMSRRDKSRTSFVGWLR